jgi:hypothetical protein
MKQYRILNSEVAHNAQANPIINESVAQELSELGHRVQYREISDWKDFD